MELNRQRRSTSTYNADVNRGSIWAAPRRKHSMNKALRKYNRGNKRKKLGRKLSHPRAVRCRWSPGGLQEDFVERRERKRIWIGLGANYSIPCQHPAQAKARRASRQLAALCLWPYRRVAGDGPRRTQPKLKLGSSPGGAAEPKLW